MREPDYYDAHKIAFDVLGVGANVEAIALVRAGYAAGYRAAQVVPLPVQDDTGANGEPVYRPKAQAAMPPRDPTQAMIDAGEKRRREIAGRGLCIGTIWRAMYDASTREQTSGGVDGHAASVGQQAAASHPGRGRPEAAPTAGIKPGPLDPIADLCARLRDEYEGCPSPVTTARVATLREAADALERLRAERAEAERDRANADAARYRWLRDGDGPQSSRWSRWSRWRIEHWASPGPTWADIRGADLDAAIDAHLKEKP